MLRDLGLIKELTYGDQHSRYDADVSNHGHVTCLRCGRIVDVPVLQRDGNLSRSAEEDLAFRSKTSGWNSRGSAPRVRHLPCTSKSGTRLCGSPASNEILLAVSGHFCEFC